MTKGFVRMVTVVIAAFSASLAHAQPPSAEDLSRSAIEAHIRVADDELIAMRIEDEHRKLRTAAVNSPDVEAAATVIFKDGFTPDALDELSSQYRLEVSRAELKVPVTQDGRVFTISVGARDLVFREGSFRERLVKAIGQVRAEFSGLAEATQGAESDRYREVAFSRSMLIFKVELLGQTQAVASLLAHARVAAVFLDSTNDDVQGYRDLQRKYAEAKRNASASAADASVALPRRSIRGEVRGGSAS